MKLQEQDKSRLRQQIKVDVYLQKKLYREGWIMSETTKSSQIPRGGLLFHKNWYIPSLAPTS